MTLSSLWHMQMTTSSYSSFLLCLHAPASLLRFYGLSLQWPLTTNVPFFLLHIQLSKQLVWTHSCIKDVSLCLGKWHPRTLRGLVAFKVLATALKQASDTFPCEFALPLFEPCFNNILLPLLLYHCSDHFPQKSINWIFFLLSSKKPHLLCTSLSSCVASFSQYHISCLYLVSCFCSDTQFVWSFPVSGTIISLHNRKVLRPTSSDHYLLSLHITFLLSPPFALCSKIVRNSSHPYYPHFSLHSFFKWHQSAFRAYHSTEVLLLSGCLVTSRPLNKSDAFMSSSHPFCSFWNNRQILSLDL